jgi:hypothetical protein
MLQNNFENPTEMDDATLAQLFDTCNNQRSNLGHDIGHEAPQSRDPFPGNDDTDEKEAHGQQHMKAEKSLPVT